jgi:hypothetical protein
MRQIAAFLSVMALAALAAHSAQGQQTYHWCMFFDASEGTPNTTNPYATTAGCVWLNSGGTISLMNQDINAQLIVNSPTLGWTPLIGYPLDGQPAGTPTTSTLLLSDYDPMLGTPSAGGDITSFGPGVLFDNNGSEYAIPDATTPGPFQFQVLTWTGTQYTTYAAAVGQPNTYTGRSAVFTGSGIYSISLPGLPDDTYGELGNMPAIIMQHELPGDANGDGRVDINDLTIVLANYGQTGTNWNEGDFTGSGTVDINDLTIVLAHYNQSVSSAGAAGVGAVPEPGALALLAVGLTALLAWGGATLARSASGTSPQRNHARRLCFSTTTCERRLALC